MKLRSYQKEAIDSIDDYFIAQRGSNPVIIAPTASGKSLILSGYITKQLKLYPDCRFMMITHRRELIEQNYEKLVLIEPNIDAGIYSASVGRKETSNSVVFAGIQSVYNKAQEIGKVDVIMIDEAHMIPKSGNGMYRQFLDEMLTINPLLKVIGLTATPYRLSGGILYEGKDRLFDGVSYEISVKYMLDNGYITPLVTPEAPLKGIVDTSNVPMNISDYVQYKLSEAVNKSDLVRKAVLEIIKYGEDRNSWIVFAVDIAHCINILSVLREYGINACMVTGNTHNKKREAILEDFKQGKIQCIINVDVLTTGFDAPNIDLIAMLRPTASTSLYIQMLGRGVRLHEKKKDCLVLDFADNIAAHGAFDSPIVDCKSESLGGGQAPIKTCECGKEVFAGLKQCPFCGAFFPPPEKVKHSDFVSTLSLLTYDEEGERTYDVAYMTFNLHRKVGSKDSCKVSYHRESGKVITKEFLCFEHSGFAKNRACVWWSNVMPDHELPITSMNAVVTLHQHASYRINRICVETKTKYKNLIRRQLAKPTTTGLPT
jgi:DNA repair protein RadD